MQLFTKFLSILLLAVAVTQASPVPAAGTFGVDLVEVSA